VRNPVHTQPMANEVVRVTLVDGSEHVVVTREGVTPRDALANLLEGPGSGWFYTGSLQWVRRDAVVRVALEKEHSEPSGSG